MNEFLTATKYCDAEHPEIQEQARRLKKPSQIDTAIEIWKYIARIDYRFDFWNVKASETLAKGYGMCTNKANLQIALLRASGIPAAYGIMKISKEAFRYISTTEFYDQIAPVTTHVFCYVYLEGKWVAADATRDYKLEDQVEVAVDPRKFPWDGRTDYKKPKYVIRELPLVANLDKKLEVKPRFLTPEVLQSINSHIDVLATSSGKEVT